MLLKKYSKGKKNGLHIETVHNVRLSNTHLEIFPEPHSFTRGFIVLAP